MPVASRRLPAKAALLIVAATVALAGCSTEKQSTKRKVRSKEYFAESIYGVKASPRVSNLRTKLPRGGGRDQVGKPYMVKGRWYYPKEEPRLSQRGEASWYGDAFHGRLTANGEVYDMTHLTAAHPTMPLPSYARVTNLKTGTSVVVRVNDRGPFERGRVIDLSRKAAEMLDYQHVGMANVRVDYVGRAPLHGRDDQFLLASYRPGSGKGVFDPNDGLPSGVMIAMNGPTPTRDSAAPNLPGQAFARVDMALQLPELGPIAPERPAYAAISGSDQLLGYAPSARTGGAAAGIAAFDAAASGSREYVTVGTYQQTREALEIATELSKLGLVEIERSGQNLSVTIKPTSAGSLDAIVQAAWSHGATDAFIVRD